MLTISVGDQEHYDEDENEFITIEGQKITLEHSLVSLSKWESIHEKPFLGKDEKTTDEIISYVNCMILPPEVSPEILNDLSEEHFLLINQYIESKHSATTFPASQVGPNRETITSELIYYWMVAYNIPFSCENWHLNRLLTLIRICNIKNQPPKKTKRSDLLKRNAELNAQRKAMFNTSG